MNSNPTIQDVLTELRAVRKILSLSDKRALTFEDVGVLMGVHPTTVRRMSKQPGFPQLREYQTDDKGNTVKRFVASEIHNYIDQKSIREAWQAQQHRIRNKS